MARTADNTAPPRWPFRLCLGVLLLLAAVLFGLSFVGFEFLKRTADSFSGSGNAEFVTPEFHAGIVLRLRVFAVALALLGFPLVFLRDLLNRLPGRWRASNRKLRADARRSLADAVREHRGVTLAVLLLIAIGVVLRVDFLNQPLRFDEGRTFLSFVQMPFAYIPLRYNQPNNHILNTILIKASTGIFGEAEWAIRLPAFVCGCLALPLGFLALRRLFGTGAALLGLALLATSSPLVEFSTNGRGYMLVLCAFLGMVLFGPYAVRERSLAGWTWTVVCGAVGATCIPIMLLPAASVLIWLAVHIALEYRGAERGLRVRDLLTAGVAMAALALLFYTPAMAINGPGSLTSNEGVVPGSLSTLFEATPAFFGDLTHMWHRDYPGVLTAVLAVCAALAVLFHRRVAVQRSPLHLAAAVVVVLYLLAISDYGWLRVWLYLVPVYLGLAAAGAHGVLARAIRGRSAAAWGTVVLAVGLAAFAGWRVHARRSILLSPETGVFPAAEAAVAEIEAELAPGDLLALYATNATQVEYYARRRGVPMKPIGDYANARWFRIGEPGAAETQAGRAWFVLNHQEGYRNVGVEYLIERPPPGLGVVAPPAAFLTSAELTLYRASLERSPAAEGKSLPTDGTPD